MTRGATIIGIAAAAFSLALPAAASADEGVPPDFFGVVPQEVLTLEDYARLADGRVGTVRLPLNWAAHQQVKGKCQGEAQVGVCTWVYLDEIMARLAIAGVRAVPVLYGSPGFVSGKHTNRPPLGKGLDGWKAFVRAAAQRYGHGGFFWRGYSDAYGAKPQPIDEWQVWNEQNAEQFWYPHPNARRYATLLKATAKALRQGDRSARVVLGGMFTDAKLSIGAFMRRLYKVKGIKRAFDELAVHPYARTIKELEKQIHSARRAVRRGHDRDAGIRVTELGWSSKEGDHRLMVGREAQARLLEGAFRLVTDKREAWNITGVNWFALRDTTNKFTCDFCLDSGLLEVGGEAKPAWGAFKKFSRPGG